jgi:hypothetical protein
MDNLNIIEKLQQAHNEVYKLIKKDCRTPSKCKDYFENDECSAFMHYIELAGAYTAICYLKGEYSEKTWHKFLANISEPLSPKVLKSVIEGFKEINDREAEARKHLKLDD